MRALHAGGRDCCQEDMASGVERFGTERERLGQGGCGAELARLAQSGFRGKFYKRNPFQRDF